MEKFHSSKSEKISQSLKEIHRSSSFSALHGSTERQSITS